jgi:hypothetical protein
VAQQLLIKSTLLLIQYFNVADQVGEFGAVAFYDAGVKQAEAMVAGIKAELERARADLKLSS